MRYTGSNESIPILDSKDSSFDTNININILDFWSRYQYQYQYSDFHIQYQYRYQYLSFENPISISIPILNNSKFNDNIDINTKVFNCNTLNAKFNQTNKICMELNVNQWAKIDIFQPITFIQGVILRSH